MKSPRSHADKMLVVHAIWLLADDESDCETTCERAAKMLRIPFASLFVDFDYDYLDRAWCSRPTNWTPQDSLAQPQS